MPQDLGNFLRLFFATAVLLSLAGCISIGFKEEKPVEPAEPVIAKLSLSLSAHPLTNLDLSGRPSPTVVRLYQLRKAVDFNEASLFDLYDRDKELLAADLLSREELVVAPGSQVDRQWVIHPEAQFVAVMAAFQDTDNAIHKRIQALSTDQDTLLDVQLSGNSLSLTANSSAPAQPASQPVKAELDPKLSQGVKVSEDGVSVNPAKLKDCQGAKAINVLANGGC